MSGPQAPGAGHRVRRAALSALCTVESGRRSDRALDAVLERHKMSSRDRALCTEIVYGTLRRQRTLDRTLTPFCRRPLAKLDLSVRVALRMAAYQCIYLRSVPPHAAVHSTVEALKRVQPRATGLANAVLRTWQRAGGAVAEGDGTWADRHELPDWLAERWRLRADTASEAWLGATLDPPPGFLRASGGSSAVPQVVAALAATGADAEPGARVAGSVQLNNADRAAVLPLIEEGLVTPRSEAAQIVTALLDAAGHGVLDACSGRGGKARQLAETATMVVALDVHAGRLADSRALARRTAAGHIAWVRADLTRGVPLRGAFARVLVDVPCSGLGTIRRHPEIKWQVHEEDLARHAATQRAILRSALGALLPGGELLYVTCSTEPEENEEVVAAVLDAAPAFARQPFQEAPQGCIVDLVGDLRTFPGDPALDGFYAARLTRPTP